MSSGNGKMWRVGRSVARCRGVSKNGRRKRRSHVASGAYRLIGQLVLSLNQAVENVVDAAIGILALVCSRRYRRSPLLVLRHLVDEVVYEVDVIL